MGEQHGGQMVGLEGEFEPILGEAGAVEEAAGIIGQHVDAVGGVTKFHGQPTHICQAGIVGKKIVGAHLGGDSFGAVWVAADQDESVFGMAAGEMAGGLRTNPGRRTGDHDCSHGFELSESDSVLH